MDPYATLNVPADASHDQIRRAFVSVARTTHPDKAQGAGSSQAANDAFASVDEAYKIVGDVQMRNAFDEYGQQGVSALQVLRTQHDKSLISKRQLREQVTLQERMLMDGKAPHSSTIKCHLQIHDLLNFLTGDINSTLSSPGFDHLLMEQSAQFELSDKDVITLHALAGSARRWKGVRVPRGINPEAPTLGLFSITYAMVRGVNMFEYSFQGSSVDSQPSKLKMQGRRALTRRIGAGVALNCTPQDAGLAFSLENKIHPTRLTGNLTIGMGNEDGVQVSCIYKGTVASEAQDEDVAQSRIVQGVFQVNPTSGFAFQSVWTEPITKRSKLRTLIQVSLGNIMLELESRKKFTGYLKLAGSLSLGLATGVTFSLKVFSGSVRFEFPILISRSVSFQSALLSGIVPWTLQYLLQRVAAPFLRRSREKRKAELKEALQKARQRALNQMLLMKSKAEKNVNESRESDGLYVTRARYGVKLEENYDWDQTLRPNIEVSTQLNFFIQNKSAIEMKSGSKSGMLGFYNPSLLYESHGDMWNKEDDDCDLDPEAEIDSRHLTKDNKLWVQYRYRGQVFEKTFQDEQAVVLPAPDAAQLAS